MEAGGRSPVGRVDLVTVREAAELNRKATLFPALIPRASGSFADVNAILKPRSVVGLVLAVLLGVCVPGWKAAETKTADRIVVEKSARTMTLIRGGQVLKTYKVALSREPLGAKGRAGDHRVPEMQTKRRLRAGETARMEKSHISRDVHLQNRR